MNTLLTEEEVAKRLHVSLASIRRWRLERRGPQFIKVGSLVRYRPEDLESWLASLPTGGAQLVKAETGAANGQGHRKAVKVMSS
jgi:excisionase family DNA binding protein